VAFRRHHRQVVTSDKMNFSSESSLFGTSRGQIDKIFQRREEVLCPLCKIKPSRFAVDFQGFTLARCSSCQLEFQNPRPVFSDLASAIYTEDYHGPRESIIDTSRHYQFKRQLGWFERYAVSGDRRILDVGCGAGAFIRFARNYGWRIDGTDVIVHANARTKGTKIWKGQLPDIVFGESLYDVVRFNHVLEHTQDPLSELCRARSLLTKGGVLHVGVPNLAGFSITLKSWQSYLGIKKQRWKHYGAIHHLWFFTPSTLRRLVVAAGFEVIGFETPVVPRSGRPKYITSAIRGSLEALHLGGVIDLFARKSS